MTMPGKGAEIGRYRSVPHWLAHWKPASVVGVDVRGNEHEIVITATQKRWAVAWRALQDCEAVTARALDKRGKVIATTAIERPDDEPTEDDEDDGTITDRAQAPATAPGYDIVAVVQCVAKEVREASREGYSEAKQMCEAVIKELTSVVKLATERLEAAETTVHEIQTQQIEARRAELESESENGELVKALLPMLTDTIAKVKKTANGANGAAKPATTPASAPTTEKGADG
jgi:hypothetical protein